MSKRKYRLYECPFDTLPKNPRAVYSHYENGRMLIFYSHRKLCKEWKLLSDKDITKLSPHEKRWYLQSRNEINAEYLKTPEVQEELLERAQRLLELYENNLKELKKKLSEVKNAENKASSENG